MWGSCQLNSVCMCRVLCLGSQSLVGTLSSPFLPHLVQEVGRKSTSCRHRAHFISASSSFLPSSLSASENKDCVCSPRVSIRLGANKYLLDK